MMPNFWQHCAISALKMSKKHFATFYFLVNMNLVSNVENIKATNLVTCYNKKNDEIIGRKYHDWTYFLDEKLLGRTLGYSEKLLFQSNHCIALILNSMGGCICVKKHQSRLQNSD